MGAARVSEIDPVADPRWDQFVTAHPEGVVYQHSGWLRCLTAEYDRPVTALCSEDERGALTGVLPLIRTRGLPFMRGSAVAGARISSLPRTPVAGPLTTDRDSAAALLEAALARAREAGARLQVKRGRPDLDGLVAEIAGVPWRRSYELELPDDPSSIRFGSSRNHARIRWAVTKAAKEGVVVRDAEDVADVRRWYALYLETMRDVLVPPRPLRLFEAIWRELAPRGLMRFHLAEKGGRLLAGSVVLGLGRTAFYAFNGRSRAALRLRPNDLLQWEAIHAAARAGFRRYDLGEVVESDTGLAEFKRKWASEEVRMQRYHYPPPPDEGEGGGTGAQAIEAVWPRVPLAVTRAAGELGYRWL